MKYIMFIIYAIFIFSCSTKADTIFYDIDGPLVLSCGDQKQYYVRKNEDFYYIAFDMCTQNLIGSRYNLTILLDTPEVRNIYFRPNGAIRIFVPKGPSGDIGSFSDDMLMHCEIYLDMIQGKWKIFINSNELCSDLFNPEDDIRSIRFSMRVPDILPPTHTYDPYVSLNNIIISNYIVSQNNAPIANADEDITVYADWTGKATVTLDGSASSDEDGDELTYLWTWNVDGVDYEATGVNPEIELPVGEYVITLVVNDGQADSEPDEVIVTVLSMAEAEMLVAPQAWNPDSHGKWVLALIVLENVDEGAAVDTNQPAVMYPMGVSSKQILAFPECMGKIIMIAQFSRSELMAELPPFCDELEVHVVAYMKDGTPFYGADTIRIVGVKGLMQNWLDSQETPGWDETYDRDGDGIINLKDFVLLSK